MKKRFIKIFGVIFLLTFIVFVIHKNRFLQAPIVSQAIDDYPHFVNESLNDSGRFVQVFWQNKIYDKQDFDVYPSNSFFIHSNFGLVESIELIIDSIYKKSPDYFISYGGKGDAGPHMIVRDIDVEINKHMKEYEIFHQNTSIVNVVKTKFLKTVTNFYGLEDFRICFKTKEANKNFAFNYRLEVTYNTFKGTKIFISPCYTYSFAPKKEFFNIYDSNDIQSIGYYISPEIRKYFSGMQPLIGEEYYKSYPTNYWLDEMKDKDEWINFIRWVIPREEGIELDVLKPDFNSEKLSNIRQQLERNIFFKFGNKYYIFDQNNKMNKGHDGRVYKEQYLTDILKIQ